MRGASVRIGSRGSVWLALLILTAPMISAQSTAPGGVVLRSASAPVVTRAGSDVRVSAGPGLVRCRTLLAEIARLAGIEIRNLGHVPDDEIFVNFSAEPIATALSTILGYAKVDFALRAGNGVEPAMVVVFGAASLKPAERVAVSAPAKPLEDALPAPSTTPAVLFPDQNAPADVAVQSLVELPALQGASETRESPRQVPLEVRPTFLQIQQAPMWRPLLTAPVTVPVGMMPKAYPVGAPPAEHGAGGQPAPAPPPKRQ
jgi:hypothetical protein